MRILGSAPVLALAENSKIIVEMNKRTRQLIKITRRESVLFGLVLLGLLALIGQLFSLGGNDWHRSNSNAPHAASAVDHTLTRAADTLANAAGESMRAAASAKSAPRPRKRDEMLAAGSESGSVLKDDVASEETNVAEDEVSTPVGLIDPLPDQVLTEEQVTEFDFIRGRFLELLGGLGQDPADPQYRVRWETAQRQLDEEFRSFFGLEAFNQQQVLTLTTISR